MAFLNLFSLTVFPACCRQHQQQQRARMEQLEGVRRERERVRVAELARRRALVEQHTARRLERERKAREALARKNNKKRK